MWAAARPSGSAAFSTDGVSPDRTTEYEKKQGSPVRHVGPAPDVSTMQGLDWIESLP